MRSSTSTSNALLPFAGFGLRFLMGLLFRPPFFRLAIVLFFGRPMIQLPGGRDGASDGRVFFTGSDYFTHAVWCHSAASRR